jgi:hypothetical protein
MVDGSLVMDESRRFEDRLPLRAAIRNGKFKMGEFRNCLCIKNKMAAPGRRSGNHCGRHEYLKDFREHRGRTPEAHFRILFA